MSVKHSFVRMAMAGGRGKRRARRIPKRRVHASSESHSSSPILPTPSAPCSLLHHGGQPCPATVCPAGHPAAPFPRQCFHAPAPSPLPQLDQPGRMQGARTAVQGVLPPRPPVHCDCAAVHDVVVAKADLRLCTHAGLGAECGSQGGRRAPGAICRVERKSQLQPGLFQHDGHSHQHEGLPAGHTQRRQELRRRGPGQCVGQCVCGLGRCVVRSLRPCMHSHPP